MLDINTTFTCMQMSLVKLVISNISFDVRFDIAQIRETRKQDIFKIHL